MSRRRLLAAVVAVPVTAVVVLAIEVQMARVGTSLPAAAPLGLDGTVGPASGPPIRVTWLGDSTAAGVGASGPPSALSHAVARLGGGAVSITNLARVRCPRGRCRARPAPTASGHAP